MGVEGAEKRACVFGQYDDEDCVAPGGKQYRQPAVGDAPVSGTSFVLAGNGCVEVCRGVGLAGVCGV